LAWAFAGSSICASGSPVLLSNTSSVGSRVTGGAEAREVDRRQHGVFPGRLPERHRPRMITGVEIDRDHPSPRRLEERQAVGTGSPWPGNRRP
jgi:hypothetical protein